MEILGSFNLTQNVSFGTHTSGHCLDLIIRRRDECLTNSPKIGLLFSDHFIVMCYLNFENANFERKQILTKNLKDINLIAFKQESKIT